MAREDVKIVISADDKSQKGLKSTARGLDKLKISAKTLAKAFVGLGVAFAGVTIAGKKALDKFFVQEKAIARLNANVENVLVSFKGFEKGTEATTSEINKNVTALREQASALQKVTTFGDEQIISAQALLSTFALGAEEIKKLTPRVLDMGAAMEKASGTAVDLEAITVAIGKAMTLGVGSLTRYGVVIDDNARKAFENADQQGKLNIILGELDKNFKGVAETVGQTAAGKMIQMQNAVGDLWEIIGGAIAEAIIPFVSKIQTFAEDPKFQQKIRLMIEKIMEFAVVAIPAALKVAETLFKILDKMWQVFLSIADAIGTVIFKIDQLIQKMKRLKDVGGSFSFSNIATSFRNLPQNLRGFDSGGIVGGPRGRPQLAMVHGGETILPTHKRGMSGTVVNINNPVLLDDTMVSKLSEKIGMVLRNEMRI